MNIAEIIIATGYLGLFAIVFAESGLFFGFFLPGDSLLFTAGFLASQNHLNFWITAITIFVAAVAGDSVGYAFGKKVGPSIFKKEDSKFFKKEYLLKAEKFYETNGAKTIVLARFIPIVRTFAPIVAGVGGMNYFKFIRYNIIGGLIWSFGLVSFGMFFGKLIPNADRYLLLIVILLVAISIFPTVKHLRRAATPKGDN
jgi:membrane-associated protein